MPEAKPEFIISAYEKRKVASIPAPLETDSDSDFNAGAFVYESKNTKRRNKRERTSRKTRKRLRENEEESDEPLYETKRPRVTRVQYYDSNPLLEYFGHDVDLQSESEEEDANTKADHEGEGSDIHTSEEEAPLISKATIGFNSRDIRSGPESKPLVAGEGEMEQSGGSCTESETESETEPDSEPEPLPQTNKKVEDPDVPMRTVDSTKQSVGQEDSEAESESEDEPNSKAPRGKQNPRPGFPLSPQQSHLGPCVLDAEKNIEIPGPINTYLREYQRDGVRFFWKQYCEGRGGLLGDDMGLGKQLRSYIVKELKKRLFSGKTIQVISFLSAIMHKQGFEADQLRRREHVSKLQDGEAWRKRRMLPPADATWPTCLIIAPSSVVPNWEREFQTWGYFEVGVYVGNERSAVLKDFKMGRLDVVLTTFDIARGDIDLLDTLPWTCIFVDEVHRLKNPSSKLAKAYHRFECFHRFGLTGTAIQNSYNEMWTILDWTNPGHVGTLKQWKSYVTKPLQVGQSTSSSEEERAKALEVALILKNKLLPRFFLRRIKDIIKDQLPKKTDQVVFCPLAKAQSLAYKRILDMEPVHQLIHKDDPCSCGSKKPTKKCCYQYKASDLLRFMSILIKLSNHLALIMPGKDDTPEQLERNRALSKVIFPDGNAPTAGEIELLPQYCGKWLALKLLLAEWKKDKTNKVLIFTKSKRLLYMLEYHLQSESYKSLTLSGDTKAQDRMPLIDQFHSDPEIFIFLITTLAGGVGLNLTGANKVVIFGRCFLLFSLFQLNPHTRLFEDPNWNPAHDLQAMDRAFRFGQTRDVHVYRLLGAGALEELIYARQVLKQQQMAIGYDASVQTRYFTGVQGDTKKKGELFGLKNIFKLHENSSSTKVAIEKAQLAQLDWALANLDSKTRNLSAEDRQLVEAEAKTKDDDVNGLASLLFTEDSPKGNSSASRQTGEDSIEKLLSSIGISYSHHNDQILAANQIEQERAKKIVENTRRERVARKSNQSSPSRRDGRKGGGKIANTSPGPQWPPIRKHHKPKPTPEEMFASRRKALIKLGMIHSREELPQFAQEFAQQTTEEQKEILARLDQALQSDSEE
ncbi:hypothetical protein E1B28_013530 [Marasmius oreades]|uniref:Uncharacterized protein n=1 Tax=Marasmius oreades TaxID=181124 RepID=A0A9P7RQT9_9AGAR|nr:uncharacterized protein E1B28_013530 [Marasmius oreades]KAG7087576.1 hypothetical protein E1B28_013530 [Marasmius oreades]